jgi:hypothetical protein
MVEGDEKSQYELEGECELRWSLWYLLLQQIQIVDEEEGMMRL